MTNSQGAQPNSVVPYGNEIHGSVNANNSRHSLTPAS